MISLCFFRRGFHKFRTASFLFVKSNKGIYQQWESAVKIEAKINQIITKKRLPNIDSLSNFYSIFNRFQSHQQKYRTVCQGLNAIAAFASSFRQLPLHIGLFVVQTQDYSVQSHSHA